jgi:pyridoxamine 5'-phosphate oxidase
MTDVVLTENPFAILFDTALTLLEEAVQDRHAPMHCLALATSGLDARARCRTITLREANRTKCFLRFHVDTRSDKYREMQHDPRIALMGYDAPRKLQIRAEGRASLHCADALADTAWETSRQMSRACYAATLGPGTPLRDPADLVLPEMADITQGRSQFCAVVMTLNSLDMLTLAVSGHRRALLTWQKDNLEGCWLAP